MQYGYDDELFQDWRDGKIGEKDLPDEVMDIWTFARGGERSKRGVGAPTRRSGSPATTAPLAAPLAAAAT